jgi:acyl carrier protein
MIGAVQVIRDYVRRELMADRQDATFDDDEDLIEAGIVDSLGIFLLIEFLQKEFAIQVQPEEVVMQNFATVNAINSLIIARRTKEFGVLNDLEERAQNT